MMLMMLQRGRYGSSLNLSLPLIRSLTTAATPSGTISATTATTPAARAINAAAAADADAFVILRPEEYVVPTGTFFNWYKDAVGDPREYSECGGRGAVREDSIVLSTLHSMHSAIKCTPKSSTSPYVKALQCWAEESTAILCDSSRYHQLTSPVDAVGLEASAAAAETAASNKEPMRYEASLSYTLAAVSELTHVESVGLIVSLAEAYHVGLVPDSRVFEVAHLLNACIDAWGSKKKDIRFHFNAIDMAGLSWALSSLYGSRSVIYELSAVGAKNKDTDALQRVIRALVVSLLTSRTLKCEEAWSSSQGRPLGATAVSMVWNIVALDAAVSESNLKRLSYSEVMYTCSLENILKKDTPMITEGTKAFRNLVQCCGEHFHHLRGTDLLLLLQLGFLVGRGWIADTNTNGGFSLFTNSPKLLISGYDSGECELTRSEDVLSALYIVSRIGKSASSVLRTLGNMLQTDNIRSPHALMTAVRCLSEMNTLTCRAHSQWRPVPSVVVDFTQRAVHLIMKSALSSDAINYKNISRWMCGELVFALSVASSTNMLAVTNFTHDTSLELLYPHIRNMSTSMLCISARLLSNSQDRDAHYVRAVVSELNFRSQLPPSYILSFLTTLITLRDPAAGLVGEPLKRSNNDFSRFVSRAVQVIQNPVHVKSSRMLTLRLCILRLCLKSFSSPDRSKDWFTPHQEDFCDAAEVDFQSSERRGERPGGKSTTYYRDLLQRALSPLKLPLASGVSVLHGMYSVDFITTLSSLRSVDFDDIPLGTDDQPTKKPLESWRECDLDDGSLMVYHSDDGATSPVLEQVVECKNEQELDILSESPDNSADKYVIIEALEPMRYFRDQQKIQPYDSVRGDLIRHAGYNVLSVPYFMLTGSLKDTSFLHKMLQDMIKE